MRILTGSVSWLAQLVLALFFAFVGFMKTTAPMPDLARYHAWVADLPEPVARLVGVSEMACALLLVLPGLLRWKGNWILGAALVLIVNQAIAMGFHALRGDLSGAIVQNLVLIGLLLIVTAVRVWRFRPLDPAAETAK